jgi:hypothetical protein
VPLLHRGMDATYRAHNQRGFVVLNHVIAVFRHHQDAIGREGR